MKRLTTIGALCAVALLAGILPVAADAGRCTEWSYDCEKTRRTNCRWEIDPFPPFRQIRVCDEVTYTGTCYSSSYVSGGTCSERDSHSHYTATVTCDDGNKRSATSHRSNSAARRLALAKCPTYSDTVRCDDNSFSTGYGSTAIAATADAHAKCPTYSDTVRCDDGSRKSGTSRVSTAAARAAAEAKCPQRCYTGWNDDLAYGNYEFVLPGRCSADDTYNSNRVHCSGIGNFEAPWSISECKDLRAHVAAAVAEINARIEAGMTDAERAAGPLNDAIANAKAHAKANPRPEGVSLGAAPDKWKACSWKGIALGEMTAVECAKRQGTINAIWTSITTIPEIKLCDVNGRYRPVLKSELDGGSC